MHQRSCSWWAAREAVWLEVLVKRVVTLKLEILGFSSPVASG